MFNVCFSHGVSFYLSFVLYTRCEYRYFFFVQSVPSSTFVSKQTSPNTQTTTSTAKTTTNQTVPTSMPSIAVTPSLSIELDDHKVPLHTIQRRSRPSSPTKRKEIRRRSGFGQDIDPSMHTYSNMYVYSSHELLSALHFIIYELLIQTN